MQVLYAFGGSKDAIERLIAELSVSAKSFVEDTFDIKKSENSNYIIYYRFVMDDGNDDLWFDEIAPSAEDNDISWICHKVNISIDDAESFSYEGDDSRDVSLRESFYIKTTIEKGF